MSACRLLCSTSSVLSRLSKLSLTPTRREKPIKAVALINSAQSTTVRFFSDSDSKEGKSAEKNKDAKKHNADPFGVHFEDGAEGLGPEADLPPIYKRDSATGRLTGEIKEELTGEEKRILNSDPIERERLMLHHLEQHWEQSSGEAPTNVTELNKLGDRVRHSDIGLNVLGRSVQAQIEKDEEGLDDTTRDETGFSKHLTPSEFESFSAFMDKKYKAEVGEDDIPVSGFKTPSYSDDESINPDNAELSLKWLTARAQREVDDSIEDNPYSDLVPGDLNPSRLINRKRAKQIPVKLLHHNNIPLLSHYLTPTGQIRNRVQTRLGARDQRRIGKLIKRARSLGLIPYIGQLKVETHGWVHEIDIKEDRAWERELKRRGLVVNRNKKNTKSD